MAENVQKKHATNERHQAAVAAFQNRREGRPKQVWDEAGRCWRKVEA